MEQKGKKMTVYHDLMQQIDDEGLLFNVKKVNLLAEVNDISLYGQEGCKPVNNRVALINGKTGDVMGIVSDRYKVVSNEEIFSKFCSTIAESDIATDGARVAVKQTPTGSRAMVDFIFPEHSLEVGGYDNVALQLCALNSFDGSLRYVVKAGGLRTKCLNGQITGDIIGSYSSTHTSQLDVGDSADQIIKMLSDFDKAANYWRGMMQIPVSTPDAIKAGFRFLNLEPIDDADIIAPKNPRMRHFKALWMKYGAELGRNLYALYNVLTDYCHTRRATTTTQRGQLSRAGARLPRCSTATSCSCKPRMRQTGFAFRGAALYNLCNKTRRRSLYK